MKNFASILMIGLIAGSANAEGLERVNVDLGFLFDQGKKADLSIANISPSFKATAGGNLFSYETSRNLTSSISAITSSFKMSISDTLDAGIWVTNNGNGVAIDYGTITGAGATGAVDSTNTTVNGFNVIADLAIPSTVIAARYKVDDNFSLLGGVKYVRVSGGQLKLGNNIDADAFIDVTSEWNLGIADGFGAVIGAAYEVPRIGLRVVLMNEGYIDLKIPTTAGVGTPGVTTAAVDGTSTASIGDATTLQFQTGIAENTLLFGSVRQSNWKNNQISVPSVAGPSQVSSFLDGESYTLGVGRKINEKLSISLSYFEDEGDGNGASELSPSGSNRSISFGAKQILNENTSISLGASYSERGDAVTKSYSASVKGSDVTTIGIKLSTTF